MSWISSSTNEDYEETTIKFDEDEMEYYDYQLYLIEEERFWGYKNR